MVKNIKLRKVPSDHLRWEAREVVRDIGQQPHLVTRVTLRGTNFPQRSLVAFVKVGAVLTTWVEIDDDEQSARAYFTEPLPSSGGVEFGYGNEVVMRFPGRFSSKAIQHLDSARLPAGIHLPSDQ